MLRSKYAWPLWLLWLVSFTSAAASLNGTTNTLPRPSENGSALYLPLFEQHSNSTPRFINSTGQTANPLIKALQAKNQDVGKRGLLGLRNSHGASRHSHHKHQFHRRADLPEGTCAPGTPCINGACCSNKGICGYAPTECDTGNCISNCNATAPCGQYAIPAEKNCPLNVCCSFFGFCGSTSEFCTTGGERPCQQGFGTCGDAPRPSCAGGDTTSQRVIGYYEGWATTRACDKRDPEDIDLTAFTHLNFAFAFFDPKSFQMAPMTSGDEDLYRRFTALKSKKSSLKTWIAVGGWSFNDPTNVPNTRTAFSDMVASSVNRQAFIRSLGQLLNTYGFDGVDLDWEYPAADDRGGVKADKANFVLLLAEMRSAFGSRYGISLTLPASYWYLQGFDVNAIQYNVDWMNMMSYDIHGVWDAGNIHTGPFLRPHANLTEIEDGLDLLWRAGVEPNKVVLGLGWYGRSFTLANAACNLPNGICTFAEGGTPGECTKSAGTLTNAEISRIIGKGGVSKGFDRTAAVKWITWDSNQWVSYDDGETTQLKIAFANSRCLGGKMIWAVDQDDLQSSSTNDLLGLGPANGVSIVKANNIKDQINDLTRTNAVASSCYWTFCGDSCKPGWFPATSANGQIAGVQRDTECPTDTTQTLCCAPGTTLGICKWEGWRGVGLSCVPVCSDPLAIIAARNTNFRDRDCNGGYQAFCCSGFVASSTIGTEDLALIGQGGLARRDGKGGTEGLVLGTLACIAAVASANILLAVFTAGISLIGSGGLIAACGGIGFVLGYIAHGLSKQLQAWNAFVNPIPRNIGTPKPNEKLRGQWQMLEFDVATQTRSSSCDCQVTYTCRYGKGWDEVCDNQRWAINEGLAGRTVFHYQASDPTARSYRKYNWANGANGVPGARHKAYRTLAQVVNAPRERPRCEVDEFPMGALREAQKLNPQIVRLLNGKANGAQGNDFRMWRLAVFTPCKIYRDKVCKIKSPEPPITWKFDGMDNSRKDARVDGVHFLKAYGFDSQTQGSLCWATFTYIVQGPIGGGFLFTSTVSDHGFRALPDDPLYTVYNWDINVYSTSPDMVYPTDIASANWERRRAIEGVLLGKSPDFQTDNNGHCEEHEVLVEHEGKTWCVLPGSVSEGNEIHTLPKATLTGTVLPSSAPMQHTKARATSGPLQTASLEGVDAQRKYIYGF